MNERVIMHETAELLERVSELAFQRAVFSVTHAIGTPLNVISGHAELLLPTAAPDLQRGLSAIVAECRSITSLLAAPVESGPRATLGDAAAIETVIQSVRDLVAEKTRARLTFDADTALEHSVPRTDAILSLWTLAEIGARLSSDAIGIKALATKPNVTLTLGCTTASENPKTARDLSEPWRPGANPAIGHLGVLCHALAALRGGRPVLTRDGARIEISLVIPIISA